MRLTTIWEQFEALSDVHINVLKIHLDGRSQGGAWNAENEDPER